MAGPALAGSGSNHIHFDWVVIRHFGFKLGFFYFPLPNLVWLITLLLSIIVVSGFALLENGNIKPRQYDRAIQLLTVIAFIPFILYFWLHIKYLKQTDGSWLFELDFMEDMAGVTIAD